MSPKRASEKGDLLMYIGIFDYLSLPFSTYLPLSPPPSLPSFTSLTSLSPSPSLSLPLSLPPSLLPPSLHFPPSLPTSLPTSLPPSPPEIFTQYGLDGNPFSVSDETEEEVEEIIDTRGVSTCSVIAWLSLPHVNTKAKYSCSLVRRRKWRT